MRPMVSTVLGQPGGAPVVRGWTPTLAVPPPRLQVHMELSRGLPCRESGAHSCTFSYYTIKMRGNGNRVRRVALKWLVWPCLLGQHPHPGHQLFHL